MGKLCTLCKDMWIKGNMGFYTKLSTEFYTTGDNFLESLSNVVGESMVRFP